MRTIVGDITAIPRGVIVHQTNCMGIMGGGLAAQIRQKWPHVNAAYEEYCDLVSERWKLLSTVQFIPVNPYLTVANAFGQLDTSGHAGECATNYLALGQCMQRIAKAYDNKLLDVYFPYKIGCGLGGGDWDTVLAMLNAYCPGATIVQLPTAPTPTSEVWSPKYAEAHRP